MQALVVDCQRNGLGIIRSLAAAGVTTYAADHTWSAPGLWSRYTRRRFCIASPSTDVRGYIAGLIAAARAIGSQDRICLIPVNDEHVLAAAAHWAELEPWYLPVFETRREVLDQCLFKVPMYRAAAAASVPHPATFYSDEPWRSQPVPYPVVVKPTIRKTPEAVAAGVFRIRLCHDEAELQAAVGLLEAAGFPYVIQQFITGGDEQLYTAGIFAYRGELCTGFVGRKLRQFPPTVGQCSYGEIAPEPRVMEYAARLVRHTGFTGIAQVEFKRQGDEYYLMEINPRSWSWNSLATFAGANLPYAGCRAVTEGRPYTMDAPVTRGHWSFLPADLWFHGLKGKGVGSTLRVVRDAWRAECLAFWHARDPLPAVALLAYVVDKAVRLVMGKSARKSPA